MKGKSVSQAIQQPRTAASGVTPTLEDVRSIAARPDRDFRTVPVYREVFADMETPVSVYLKLTNGTRTPGFLLESVEGGKTIARYSFIGANVAATVALDNGELSVDGTLPSHLANYDDPLEAIQEIIAPFRTEASPNLPRFTGGAVGYLAYDAIRRFEPRVPKAKGPGLGLPEAHFHVAETLVVFDHLERVLKVVSHVPLDGDQPIDDAYARAVRADRRDHAICSMAPCRTIRAPGRPPRVPSLIAQKPT